MCIQCFCKGFGQKCRSNVEPSAVIEAEAADKGWVACNEELQTIESQRLRLVI